MGCDPSAFAVIDEKFIHASQLPGLRAQFAAAAKEVVSLTGGVDIFLGDLCSLDCSASEQCLAEALGFEKIPRGKIWMPDDVQRMGLAARWAAPSDVPAEMLVFYWSARRFFELCVKNRLGIWLD